MAAAAQVLPAPANGELNQQYNAAQAQYNRLVKEEVLDPSYIIPVPPQHLSAVNGVQPVSNGVSALPPVATGVATADPVKRPNARKPSGASKPKKVKAEPTVPTPDGNGATPQTQITDHMPVQKKKRDRFKGTTEEEVLTRVLPDHVREDLDILIVGINPGLTAAYVQHHYAGPGNHFWKCLFLSKMIPEPMNALQDSELLNYGIGFTNIVARTTRGSADLSKKEIYEGGQILKEKMLKYLPKIALFNGKGIYEVFCGHKKFYFGLQPEPFPGCPNTAVFVNPSSSARCTQLPRAVDKVPFYEALKRVRDHIRAYGSVQGLDPKEVTFPDFKLVTAPQKVKKEVKVEPTEENGTQPASQLAAVSQPAPVKPAANKAKTTKPRKPRGRPKKETTPGAEMPLPAATDMPPIDQQHIGGVDYSMAQANQMMQQQQQQVQAFPNMAGGMLPQHSQQHQQPNPMYSDLSKLANTAHAVHETQNTAAGDYTNIKREVLEGNHPDKDLTAILNQSMSVQQSMFQQQQSLAATNMMQHTMNPINGANFHPALMMPVSSVPSSVKQERPDWPGYGEMPAYTSAAPTTMSAYPQYSCYWNYLPQVTNGGPSQFMTNPYSSIPSAPQIAHQQAVAAVSALHTSVNGGNQPNIASNNVVPAAAPAANTAPAGPAYNNPQEASSPAMSSQSNLTQASLDSLPKADSASSVVNWLQTIPK